MSNRIHNSCSCLLCKNSVTVNNFNKHYDSKQCRRGFKASVSHKTIENPVDLKCIYCDKVCKSENSYRQHLIRCSKNPNKINVVNNFPTANGRASWSKGLTKETDTRLAESAKKLSVTMKRKIASGEKTGAWSKEYWTEEKRKEKSEWRKQLHKSHPETHPNRRLAGNRNKMTYPERVAFDWLTTNKINFEPQKLIVGKYVDFCIDNNIIEIDGERWHPIGNEKDKLRDVELQELGYTVFRIRSKERIEERLKEILSVYCPGVGEPD